MNTHTDQVQTNKNQAAAQYGTQAQVSSGPTSQITDNRPEAVMQRKLQETADNSPGISELRTFQKMATKSHQVNQADQPSATLSNRAQTMQRATDMDDEDWSKDRARDFMMNKQTRKNAKGEEIADLEGQNKANASIWYNTIFSEGLDKGNSNYDADQERVLKEQQAMLKKHFLAMAVMEVQGGKQHKKGGILGSSTEEEYQPIENFQQQGTSSNLATLASGGGRFNYRSTDGSGEEFNSFLMGADNLDAARSTASAHGGMQPSTHMGAYKRIGTHSESFDDGQIMEIDKKFGGIDSTGFDIPIGGIGQELTDAKGRKVITGYQGVSKADRRGRHIGNDQKKYQTGHGFHRHATSEDGQRSLTQIAFEGSGPHMDNIHGGSHGVKATIGKKILGKTSSKTLTGQDKRSELGLPKGLGGIKADVTDEKVETLKIAYSVLESLAASDKEEDRELEKTYFKRLLTSENAEERELLVQELLNQANANTAL